MGKARSHAPRGNAVWDALRPVREVGPLVRRGASRTAFPRRTVGTSTGDGAVVFGEECRKNELKTASAGENHGRQTACDGPFSVPGRREDHDLPGVVPYPGVMPFDTHG